MIDCKYKFEQSWQEGIPSVRVSLRRLIRVDMRYQITEENDSSNVKITQKVIWHYDTIYYTDRNMLWHDKLKIKIHIGVRTHRGHGLRIFYLAHDKIW